LQHGGEHRAPQRHIGCPHHILNAETADRGVPLRAARSSGELLPRSSGYGAEGRTANFGTTTRAALCRVSGFGAAVAVRAARKLLSPGRSVSKSAMAS